MLLRRVSTGSSQQLELLRDGVSARRNPYVDKPCLNMSHLRARHESSYADGPAGTVIGADTRGAGPGIRACRARSFNLHAAAAAAPSKTIAATDLVRFAPAGLTRQIRSTPGLQAYPTAR